MRLTFLGTSASEGYPDAFCDCANCESARSLGGSSLRKRSAALIGDDLLLDFGPDLIASSLIHGISLANVRYCLLTHEHGDHLDTTNFNARYDSCGPNGLPHLDFVASEGALRTAAIRAGVSAPAGLGDPDVARRLNVTVHPIGPFATRQIGPYLVSTILLNHGDNGMVPLGYLVEGAGRSVLYCTDTSVLPDVSFAALAARSAPIDALVLDHTFGLKPARSGHLNQEQFLTVRDRFRADGVLSATTRVFAHHLGHHSNPPHPLLAEIAAQHDYEVAYDGLVVDL